MNKVVVAASLVLLATVGMSAYAYTVYLPSLNGTSGTTSLGNGASGTLSIYLTDGPPNAPTLKFLLVNVNSVTLVYSSNVGETTSTTSSSTSTETSSSVTTSVSSSTTMSSTTSSSTTMSSTLASSSTSTGDQSQNRFVFDVPATTGENLNITSLKGNSILLGETGAPAGDVVDIIFNITGATAHWTDGSSTQLKVVANGKLMIPVHFTIQKDGSASLTVDLTPNDVHISAGQASVLTPVIHVTVVSAGTTTTTTEATTTESETLTST